MAIEASGANEANVANGGIGVLPVGTLLSNGDLYRIPVYQRNYAWGAPQVEQLIQDVIDYALEEERKPYYIGSLVVAGETRDGKDYFSTIDGQQRLTTLSILASVIKNKHKGVSMEWFKGLNLVYQSRERSSRTLSEVFKGKLDGEDAEAHIISAFKVCERELPKKLEDNGLDIHAFADYLYNFVTILRVPLGKGIDLNHYFEIMNSRGEQLEKHEVLKAQLMEVFNAFDIDKRERYDECFNLVWEGCSNMERYIQHAFSTDQRDIVFGKGDWDTLSVDSFDELVGCLGPLLGTGHSRESLTIGEILREKPKQPQRTTGEANPDKFSSVVNFPNFLLHILKVQVPSREVALDDKNLVKVFHKVMPKDPGMKLSFVKDFIFNLLKGKFLFDKYIIKREFTGNTDRWSLRSMAWYAPGSQKNGFKYSNTFRQGQGEATSPDNRRIIMLLSMFHVSLSSMSYKHWLNAALNYLFHQVAVDGAHYISFLEHTAKKFVFDRALVPVSPGVKLPDYHTLIYENGHAIDRSGAVIDTDRMRYGNIETNLVFNFVDYLLWLGLKDSEGDQRVRNFEFSPRSSVEHYYPQTPIHKDVEPMGVQYLHAFGNLCLISHDKNSRYSNFPPNLKKNQYPADTPIDSVKQYLMMQHTQWWTDEVVQHENHILHLLEENLKDAYCAGRQTGIAEGIFNKYKKKDGLLLARAVMCFGGDSKSWVSGRKFSFKDFGHIRQSDAFKAFGEFMEAHPSYTLSEVISDMMADESLRKSFRYAFVAYPSIMEYCGKGEFISENNGRYISLLESHKRTSGKATKLYTYLAEEYLGQRFGKRMWSDFHGLTLCIDFVDGAYRVVDHGSGHALELHIWENDGASISYGLHAKANGNAAAIKALEAYRWEKDGGKTFIRLGKAGLLPLGDNCHDNILTIQQGLDRLLRNGFGIR